MLHKSARSSQLQIVNCIFKHAQPISLREYVNGAGLPLQILPWLSYSVPGVLNLGSFTLETGTALWCFLLCVIADPGRCDVADMPLGLHAMPVT